MHALLAVSVVVSGLAAYGWLAATRPAPAIRMIIAQPLSVDVRTIEHVVEDTPISVHGTVRPKNQISVVPQVSGTLTYVHPELAQGRVVPKGTLLFQIDPAVYEARVQQVQAEIHGYEAVLARHDQEAENLDSQIATLLQMLAIDETDYETSRALYDTDRVGTRRDLDLLRQKYLRQKSAAAELQSRRSMIPHLRYETQAQHESALARLRQAQHDLDATSITSPFEARIESVNARSSQFVTAHFSIATLTDVEAFELSVAVDPRDLRWLDNSIHPSALANSAGPTGPEVTVRWSLHGQGFSWKGRVARFERVDESTRTARMVVEIRQADMTVQTAGETSSQTLSIGMFCRAELPVNALLDALLVPRHAVHDNEWVYVFVPDRDDSPEAAGRLERRRVPMLRAVGDNVLVDYRDRREGGPCELAPGERVVVSALTKPVIGMPVRMRAESSSSKTAEGVFVQSAVVQGAAMRKPGARMIATAGGGGR